MWAKLTWYDSCIFFLHHRFPTPSLQDWLRQWWEFSFKTLLAKLSCNSEPGQITLHCLAPSFMPSGLCKLRVTEQAGADSPRSWARFSVHYFIHNSQAALRQETGTISEKEWERCMTAQPWQMQRLYPKVCPQDKWIKVTCATLVLAFSRFKAMDFINSMCSFSHLILFHNNFQIMQDLARAFSK